MDITVLVVDWARLARVPAQDRLRVVQEAAYGDADADGDVVDGWVWPAAAEQSWLGRYEFRGTLGSHKPHFWAAEGWEKARGTVGVRRGRHSTSSWRG
ncbi:hypothetical protein [Streptomyces sp. C8S0]|uniref:hypothetical protein n=1 Tax=Streptomyces sp. C8S0 TaxID=2585716 RepID=UPI001867413C|nr:hypothetical protein [Streptomyces sp. C8S0]